MSQIYDFLSILRYPIGWCLQFLAKVFASVPVLSSIGAFGLAIITTTLIIRGLLFPLFGWQLRTQRRVQQEQRVIAPELQALRKKYKGDQQRLSVEMKALYAEHNMSPFSSMSGCLPMLVQLPVLFGLYRGIFTAIQGSTSTHFLWISNVSQSVHDACCKDSWGNVFTQPALLIIPLIAAAATFMQSRMMMPPLRDNMTDQERSMVSVSRNMSYIFPVLIFIMSLSFPQGLAMYWVTNTLVMVAQQYHLVGWGSLHVPSWVPGAHRVTPLSYPKEDHTASRGSGGRTAPARSPRPAVPARPAVPSRNGSNGAAAQKVAEAAAPPSAPGRGRAPARVQQKKAKRRR